jgi:predicted 3-demethylubiquinone-9 3-methyltransferase (glyoxalase superfamily)
MPTITPFLWFETEAEEAMNLYVSTFKRSKVLAVHRVQGRVMSVELELNGQKFMALNGGPHHKFTEAISFFVSCETQQEIDELWAALTAGGGTPSQCGWLKDKFGLSWQIIPASLGRMLGDKDAAKSSRVRTPCCGWTSSIWSFCSRHDGKVIVRRRRAACHASE